MLYALAAAAIPLLIHLLNRRKIKQIPFSTIQFLKRLEKKQMRNLRIRQILLLILRTAIIAMLVLAFARPTLRSGAAGLLAERSAIEAEIVLDNSLSLNETRLTGTLLEQLRSRFSNLESAFRNGDRISIRQATIPQELMVHQESFQSNLWERILQGLQTNYLKSDLNSSVSDALETLMRSSYPVRELYLLSDFQSSAVNDLTRLQETLKKAADNNIRVFTLPIAHENYENISVDSVEVINRLVEVNQPLKIRAVLYNHHPDKYLTTLASVILNKNRVAQQNLSLEPGQAKAVEFQVTLTENGFVEGAIEIESDALLEDNRRYFNFYVPQKIRLLHLSPLPAASSYVPLILQPAIDAGVFELQSEAFGNWTAQSFNNYDMILIEDADQFPETLVQRLKTFVDQGGGAMIIPGENAVSPQYQSLLKSLGLGDFLGKFGSSDQKDQFLTLNQVNWQHPIFEGLFETNRRQVAPVEVYAGYQLKNDRRANVLLRLSDRSPLLIQSNLNNGTAFCFAAPLKLNWSQLATRGLIVPLMYRAIYYSGLRKVNDRQGTQTGKALQQQFIQLEAPFNFNAVSGAGAVVKLTPRFRGSDVYLSFNETRLPGNYRIQHNQRTLGIWSVNSWAEESQMRFLDQAAMATYFPGAIALSDALPLEEQIKKSRFGKELWRTFLIIAFVLMFIEMIVARTGARKLDSAEAGEAVAMAGSGRQTA